MPTKSVVSPALGLYLGQSAVNMPKRALSVATNVRVRQGKVVRGNLGWAPFPNADDGPLNLDGLPVTLITEFNSRTSGIRTLFANPTDLFVYDENGPGLFYLSPRYETGTVDVTNGSPTVDGTTVTWQTEGVKAGDFIAFGATGENDPTATWYEVLSVDAEDQLTLTENYAGTTDTGIDYTIRKTFTADADDFWCDESFYNGGSHGGGTGNDRWYGCNGINKVVAWDGVDDQVYVPDLGNVDSCRAMRRHSNRLLFIAPTISGSFEPFKIRTSDVGKPEDTVNGEAAEFTVHDRSDELVAAHKIGDLLAIYGQRSITLAEYIGAPFYYAFRTVVDGYGSLSPRGIARFPDHHLFVASDSQYLFDGARAVAVNTHIWRDVLRRQTPERNFFIHHVQDEENGDLIWSVPLTSDSDPEAGQPENAFVHHYLEERDDRNPDPHTQRSIPARFFGKFRRPTTLTFDQLEESFEEYNFRWNDKFFVAQFAQVLMGDDDGNIFILNESPTANGVDLTSAIRFPRVPIGDVRNKAVVQRIYPFFEGISNSTNEVTVNLYTTDSVEGVLDLASTLPLGLSMGGESQFVSPRKAGRFVEVEFSTSDGQFYWASNGYAIEYSVMGQR